MARKTKTTTVAPKAEKPAPVPLSASIILRSVHYRSDQATNEHRQVHEWAMYAISKGDSLAKTFAEYGGRAAEVEGKLEVYAAVIEWLTTSPIDGNARRTTAARMEKARERLISWACNLAGGNEWGFGSGCSWKNAKATDLTKAKGDAIRHFIDELGYYLREEPIVDDDLADDQPATVADAPEAVC